MADRTCIRCSETKQIDAFTNNRNVCKDCVNARQRYLYETNPDLRAKKSANTNKNRKKQKNNPRFVFLRTLINNTLRVRKTNKRRPYRAKYDLGYGHDELRSHIESQFTKEMNWSNRGIVWEIDHIKPISKFTNNEPPQVINSLSNLRPLLKKENQTKAAKWNYKAPSFDNIRQKKRPVVAMTLDGVLVKEYGSSMDVVRDGFDPTCVWKVCSNTEGRSQHKGLIFKFKDHG